MTGGSTIVEFWRENQNMAGRDQQDDVLLLEDMAPDIEEPDPQIGVDPAARRARIILGVVAAAWLGFSGWALASSGSFAAGPAAWANAIVTMMK